MATREPPWWYGSRYDWASQALMPISSLYGWVVTQRYRRTLPAHAAHPVVCIGNFTAGGTGKTPLALALADLLRREQRQPWFLSRGYGGRLVGPVRVEPARHTAADVGDEPLLLAAAAPTIVTRDRRAGAMMIAASAPAEAVIIMDDGLQNPSLAKDLTIAVVDGHRGVGNGRVMPSGPLRAPLAFQLNTADMIVVNGTTPTLDPSLEVALAFFGGEVIRAKPVAAGDTAWLKDRRVLAFAGIANPQRFFTLLEGLGARLVVTRVYGDHAVYSEREARALMDAAKTLNCDLVTTAKDMARLGGTSGPSAELAHTAKVVAMSLSFTDEDRARLQSMIQRKLIALRQPS